MKNILILMAIVVLASCSSDDSKDNNKGEFEEITTILPQGEWKVGKFMNGEDDQTVNFESFVFTFDKDGGVLAQNDLFSETGVWKYYKDGEGVEELKLTFGQIEPFDSISADWDIVSIGTLKIELINKGSGLTDTKLLTFLKI